MKFTDKKDLKKNGGATVPPTNIIDSIKSFEEMTEYIEVTDIPSKFMYYPAGTKIYVRPFSVKDVKSLANMNPQTVQTVTNSVLAKNLRGIPLEMLTTGDKYYLIFLLRALTYKDTAYSINFDCDHCDVRSSFDFNAEALDVEYAKEVDLSMTLPISKKQISFRIRKVADELQMKEFIEINGKNINDFDLEIFDVACEIEAVEGQKISLLQAYEFVLGMTPEDFVHLISYLDKLEFGIKPEIKAKCSKCGGTTPVGVNFQDARDFFVPRIQL